MAASKPDFRDDNVFGRSKFRGINKPDAACVQRLVIANC
jgi:hypothetical protein